MTLLTQNQIKDIARTVASIEQTIVGFYNDPNNEKAYQDWYFKKYGRTEKESNYE